MQNYYRYDGLIANSSVNNSFYPYDLSTVVFNSNYQPIDILPMDTLYTVDTTWFTNMDTPSSGSNNYAVIDTGEDLYVSYGTVGNGFAYVYDVPENKYIIVTPVNSVYKINKSTKAITTIDLSNDTITIYNETGTSNTRYLVFSTIPNTCILYKININSSHNVTSEGCVFITAYISNSNNQLSDTEYISGSVLATQSYYVSQATEGEFAKTYTSLGLVAIKKPDLDICNELATEILGVI